MLVSDQERKQALGDFTNQKEKEYYTNLCRLFTPMNKPEPGDWLHSHKEVHQAYANYRLPNYNEVTPERNVIYIQEFGKFNKEFIKDLSDFCSAFYLTLKVKCLPPLNFETELSGIKKRKNVGDQYLAQDILAYMEKRIPKDAYCVMGITLKDIYPGDNWNFVYGWAKYKARVGIFSFVRWDQDFFYGEKNAIDWNLIKYPSIRTMVHEIGHMFAVTHCVYNRCLMNGYNNIQENYKNPLQFCPICYRKICKNIGFDKAERHRMLIKYCEQSDVKQLKKDQLLYEEILKLDLALGPEVKEKAVKRVVTDNNPGLRGAQSLAMKQNVAQKSNSIVKPVQKPTVIQNMVPVAKNTGIKTLFKPNNISVNGLIPILKQVQKTQFDPKIMPNLRAPLKPTGTQKPPTNAANTRGKSTQQGGLRKN